MGSSADRWSEEQDEMQRKEDKRWLDRVADEIKATDHSNKIEEWKFIIKNKEKIIRNRRLIELLG